MNGSAGDLKARALDLGFTTVGVCDAEDAASWSIFRSWLDGDHHGTMAYLERHAELRRGVKRLLPSAQSVVAVSLNYLAVTTSREAGQPRIARYALGRDYHRVLRSRLARLARWIGETYPGAESRVCVDTAPVLEREYAHRAGLGWFGKNTLLIDAKRGSWFFVGLLASSVWFERDKPSLGACGTCRKCVEACPTGAIQFEDGRWMVDAITCVSYLTIEHKGPIGPDDALRIGAETFGCDVCQEVCPFNLPRANAPLRAAPSSDADVLATRRWPSLKELADIDYEEWDKLTRGSAVRRVGHDGLRRNASINLANTDG